LGGVFATNVVTGTVPDDDFRIVLPGGNDGTFSFVSVSNRMHSHRTHIEPHSTD